MNTGHAEHVRLIPYLVFVFSLISLFACLTSLVQAASPSTSITGNTVTGNVVTQIVPPPPGGKIYGIQGGQTTGTNLFHSFGQFNVGAGDTAQFQTSNLSPNTAISNILGRVNGQQSASQIFGTIDSATFYPSANLFLMNPYGFLFGPTATVNVGGMVAFTSADYLRLQGAGGDGIFYANAAANSVLTSAPVAAFGFLGSNPGAITVQGSQFSVTPGQSLSLVGGNITIQSGTPDNGPVQSAKLSAPGGQINLASVASSGEILAGTMAQAPNINGQAFGAMGTINISEQSVVDVSGLTGGKISIRSGQLQIDNATLQSNTVLGDSGDIEIASSEMSMKGGSIQTSTVGPGIAGDIAVDTRTLTMSDGAFMASSLLGAGNGGNIRINATESISISGFRAGITFLGPVPNTNLPSGLYAQTFSAARGGNVDVTTPQLHLQGGTLSSTTFGPGRAGDNVITVGRLDLTEGGRLASGTVGTGEGGNVTVRATDSIHVSGQFPGITGVGDFTTTNLPSGITNNTNGPGKGGQIAISTPVLDVQTGLIIAQSTVTGQGGSITMDVGELSLTKGGIIASSAFGNGPGGSVSLNATGTISISGRSGVTYSAGSLVFDNTQSGIATTTFGPQSSGNVTVSARNLVISNEGVIQAATGGSGPAGTISISVENATLATGARISSSSGLFLGNGLFIGDGQGGAINLKATDTLTVSGQGSGLFTSTVANGNGGAVNVQVSRLDLRDGGVFSASTIGSGTAGTVTVHGLASPAQSILIDGGGTGIFTNTSGSGAGGNTNVSTQSLTIQNGGTISAATSGSAPSATGGNITINANQVQVNSGGIITAATTGAGAGGSLNINAGNTFMSNAGSVSSTATQTTGGDINIAAGNSVTLTNGASISVSSTGQGNAGSININAGNQLAMTNSTVTTEATQSGGGLIKITTTPSGGVQLTNSKISASVLDGNGGGGSVNIDPQFVVLQNSQILAQAVQGPGGNISITTNLLLPDSTSIISASSQFGQQGSVTIQSPIAPAGGKVFPLQQKPLLATTMFNQRCAALAGGSFSSFTLAGRDSLPPAPGGWLSSPLALGTISEVKALEANSEQETPLLSLRQIAPPGFLTQAFAMESSGCQS